MYFLNYKDKIINVFIYVYIHPYCHQISHKKKKGKNLKYLSISYLWNHLPVFEDKKYNQIQEDS